MILGIDYGRKHIGLAIGDTETKLALPLTTLKRVSDESLLADIKKIIKERLASSLVLGVPITWPEDRSRPGMREEIENFANQLESTTGLNVVLIDERRTSLGAVTLRQEGSGVDEHTLAATLILQTYLDKIK